VTLAPVTLEEAMKVLLATPPSAVREGDDDDDSEDT
jgi:hypothetical protein